MATTELEPQTRTRQVDRTLTIHEARCTICGTWREYARRPALTCSNKCRQERYRRRHATSPKPATPEPSMRMQE